MNIKKDDLQRWIREAVQESLTGVMPQSKKYLTKKDICNRFSVSLMTVNNWVNRKILHPLYIGGRVLFDTEELEKNVHEVLCKSISMILNH